MRLRKGWKGIGLHLIKMTQPTMTCDKCGISKIVTKSPESTKRWFVKHHKNCGNPIYKAGLGFMTKLVGQ